MTNDEFLAQLEKNRADAQDSKDKADQINAVKQNGDRVVGALKDHTSELTSSIHDLLMATMVSKDPRIAETARNLSSLLGEIKNATVQIQGANFKPLADNLAKLQASMDTVPAQIAEAHKATDPTPLLNDIHATLKKKNFSPNISVKSPTVDTTGIEQTLINLLKQESDEIDFDDYMAHDLDEMEQGVQYVGFVNSKGNWYIVKNVEVENTLRYAFGTDAYSTFWPRASQLEYTLLNEALHATTT